MTVLSPASWAQYASYDARNDRLHVSSLLQSLGATRSDAFTVTQTVVASMNLTVGSGTAYINCDWASVQGAYCFVNDAPITVTVQPADNFNPRIDRVIARVYDAYYEGTETKATIEIKKGDPAVSPQLPALPSSCIEIARIYVAANATTIITGNIDNTVMPVAGFRSAMVNSAINPWSAYTPTLTSITLGNGSIATRYQQVGKTVHARGVLVFGSTTTIAANGRVSLPIAPIELNVPIGSAMALDSSAGLRYPGICETASGDTVTTVFVGGRVTNLVPFTWATGDQLLWNSTYEIA